MSISLQSDKGTGLSGYTETLAQSFFVDKTVFITKLDLFFSKKDSTFPVEVSIRKIENNFPSQNVISRPVVIPSANINISANSLVATTAVFTVPIKLDSGQYCIVLASDSKDNKVYTASLGREDISTGAIISKQAYTGVLYMSSNGSAWNIDQTKDLKFKLYRANFTSATGTVDLVLKNNTFTRFDFTKADYLKSYAGSAVVKIKEPNHGFSNGDSVWVGSIHNSIEFVANANADIKINGIPYEKISNTIFTVSNVTNDAYTIILSTNTATTANITSGYFGTNGILVTKALQYATFVPAINIETPLKTAARHSIKTTDSSKVVSDFRFIEQGTINFTEKQLLVDRVNRNLSMSDAEPFVYRLQLSSDDTYVSPVIHLPSSSVLFVTPDINDPSSSDNLNLDLRNIATANANISFSALGIVTCNDADVKANVKTMSKGAFVTISGAGNPNNNGTFRLVDVAIDGSYFRIPAANVEGVGNAITLTYRPTYIAEETAYGGTARAKYITRKVDLLTPATSMLIRFVASKPVNSTIEIYYKTKNGDEITNFDEKEYTKMNLGNLKNTQRGQFLEIEALVDGLAQFSSYILKIVLKSSDIANYPELGDLRVITLE